MIKKAFNRRMLLRSAPAAALVAPTISQEAVRNTIYSSAGLVETVAPASLDSAHSEWLARHKQRFLDIIDGKKDPERELYARQHLDIMDAHRLDSLRSLSPVSRARIYAETTKRRRDEIEVEHAKINLVKIAKGVFKL